MSETLIFCSTCKCNKSPDQFVKEDQTFKTCNKCRERKKPVSGNDSDTEEADDEFSGRNFNYKTRYKKYQASDPEFDIPLEDFVLMIVDKCYYCGKRDLARGFNGIDRVDPTLPHIPTNCVPCCWICNRMKSDMDVHQWINHIHRISEYIKKNNIL